MNRNANQYQSFASASSEAGLVGESTMLLSTIQENDDDVHSMSLASSVVSSSDGSVFLSVPPPPPPPRQQQQGRSSSVRSMFHLALLLALAATTVLLVLAHHNDQANDWFEETWELGVSGYLAQRRASMALIHTPNTAGGGQAAWDPSSSLGAKVSRVDPNELWGSIKGEVKNDDDGGKEVLQGGCEATVMLIRHCEKGGLKSHCNYMGAERAAYLATLFGHDHRARWPVPSQIYALHAGRRHGKKHNFRELETVQVLANNNAIDVNEDYKTSDDKTLARKVLSSIMSGEQCGKLILISWKHSDLPHLAQRLGCGPMEGCPLDYRGREFDLAWQIKYVFRDFHQDHPHLPKKHSSVKMRTAKQQVEPMTGKHWDVFGSVQPEGYDPLAFAKEAGDYPEGGTPTAARWKTQRMSLYD